MPLGGAPCEPSPTSSVFISCSSRSDRYSFSSGPPTPGSLLVNGICRPDISKRSRPWSVPSGSPVRSSAWTSIRQDLRLVHVLHYRGPAGAPRTCSCSSASSPTGEPRDLRARSLHRAGLASVRGAARPPRRLHRRGPDRHRRQPLVHGHGLGRVMAAESGRTAPPPPPPPAEITYEGKHAKNPLAERQFAGCAPGCPRSGSPGLWRGGSTGGRSSPAVLPPAHGCRRRSTAGLHRAGHAAGAQRRRRLGTAPAPCPCSWWSRCRRVARVAAAVSTYAERRITPRLTTEADTALVEAVCRVEAARIRAGRLLRPAGGGGDGRGPRACDGSGRDQRFLSALVRMATAGGVLSLCTR